MAFDRPVLDRLAEVEEVEIETTRRAGGTRRTIIWVVVDGNDAFIRSVRGAGGRWYQEIVADPRAVLHVPGLAPLAVRAFDATDDASVERCSRELERKYAADPSARAMVSPDVVSTTLRLEPA